MFKIETKIEIEARCDQCTWRKSDDPRGAGWFIASSTNPAHLEEYRSNPHLLPFLVTIHTWNDELAARPDAKHLCRVECARNFLDARLYEFETALLPKEEEVMANGIASVPEPAHPC